jgi:hypothetical protein
MSALLMKRIASADNNPKDKFSMNRDKIVDDVEINEKPLTRVNPAFGFST